MRSLAVEKGLLERKAIEREEMLRALMEFIPEGVAIIDSGGKPIWISRYALETLGQPPENVLGVDVEGDGGAWRLYRPGEADLAAPASLPLARALRGETSQNEEWEVGRLDGTKVQILVNAGPWLDERGRVNGAVASWVDISERKAAEEGIAQLAAVVQCSKEAIIAARLDGTITAWSPGARDTYGYTTDEMIGKSIAALVPPERMEELSYIVARLARGEFVGRFETVRQKKDGSLLDIEMTVSPLRDRRGRIFGASSVERDITDRRRIEEERGRLLAELDATIDSAAVGIVIYDANLRISRANSAAEQIVGVHFEEAPADPFELMRTLQVRQIDGSPVHIDEIPISRALRGETVQDAMLMLQTPDGKNIWITTSAAPIAKPEGELLGVVLAFSDITELHRLQEQKEIYTHTISHDLRTPLSVIAGHAQLMEEEIVDLGVELPLRPRLKAIKRSSDRMSLLIQDLVDAARLEGDQLLLDLRPISLPPFLADLLDRNSAALETGRVRLRMPASLPRVMADEERLERIVTNLLSNALKYGHVNTPVTVSAEQERGRVRVTVTDEGPGIPSETLSRLFEPFARAPESRKSGGLGLGLYIARMLIEAHGGCMWAESEVGRGSSFHFTLPVGEGRGAE